MKPHRTDGVSLMFGLLFLGLVAWWLLAQIFDLALPAVGWFVAGGLILLGVLGLLGALRANRNSPPTPPAPASTPQGPTSAAQGPTSAAQGPTSAAQGPTSAAPGGGDDPTVSVTGPPATDVGYDGTGYHSTGYHRPS